MAAVLTTIGEEYVLKNSISGQTFPVGLYNDATDTAGDATDLAAITTEPATGNYARQTMTAQLVENASSNWQMENSAQLSYDTTNTTESVDAYFIVANFQSTTAGDGAPTDHIIATGLLSQTRDLSQVDTFNIAANTVGVELD